MASGQSITLSGEAVLFVFRTAKWRVGRYERRSPPRIVRALHHDRADRDCASKAVGPSATVSHPSTHVEWVEVSGAAPLRRLLKQPPSRPERGTDVQPPTFFARKTTGSRARRPPLPTHIATVDVPVMAVTAVGVAVTAEGETQVERGGRICPPMRPGRRASPPSRARLRLVIPQPVPR